MKRIYLLLVSIAVLASCEKPLTEYEEPSGKVSGVVEDNTTHKGLKDVFIVFEKIENGALHGTMSKADGSFSFGALASGEYKIYGVQDTLRMAKDTLRVKVSNGQSVALQEKLFMDNAGIPEVEVPVVVVKTHNSITLRVPYHSNGSVVAAYGFFYTTESREPLINDTRKGASIYNDIIRAGYYEVVISGLKANTTYHIKAYLYVKNWTPLISHDKNNHAVLSDMLTIATDPVPVN